MHATSRGNLRPDPESDAVLAIFFSISNDAPPTSPTPRCSTGIIYLQDESAENRRLLHRSGALLDHLQLIPVADEVSIFRQLAQLFVTWNPDILVGYEIEMLSWGYVLQRGTKLGIPIYEWLSRVPAKSQQASDKIINPPEDIIEGGYIVEKNSDISIVGRIVLNLWRLLRVEVSPLLCRNDRLAIHGLVLPSRARLLFRATRLKTWPSTFCTGGFQTIRSNR